MNFPMHPNQSGEQLLKKEADQKLEQLDKIPTVEHHIFNMGKSVFIKTSFPHKHGIATSYVLVESPSEITQQELEEENERLFGKPSPEELKGIRRGFDLSNKPHVFKGIKKVKEWLDGSYYSSEEKENLRIFLDI